MVLRIEKRIEDRIEDAIGICLRELHSNSTWTAEKFKLFRRLMDLAKSERYFYFKGDFRDYHLERKGQSCLYDVPVDQHGALKKFRGKRVRLICAGAWNQYSGRYFLAKSIRSV